MRKFINIIMEADSDPYYKSIVEFPETKVFKAYHGTDQMEPFDEFNPEKMNSRAGRAHGAFFFAGSKSTAMTYLDMMKF